MNGDVTTSAKPKRGMSAMKQLIRRLMNGPEATAGAALVEFAICTPLFVALLIGSMDFGLYIFQQMEVEHAAQAGAQYIIASMASQNGYTSSNASSAVTHATSFTQISASPAPSQFCGCPSSTGVQKLTAANCSQGHCTTGTIGTYVTVAAQATYNPIVISSMFATTTLSASATVRIQ
jgi:Flp pilus assembly protein TadG